MKYGPRLLRIRRQFRNCHQAAQFQAGHQKHAFYKPGEFGRVASRLRYGRIQPHFDQHGQAAALSSGVVQLFGEGQRIKRINCVKETDGPRGLVPLQMAD